MPFQLITYAGFLLGSDSAPQTQEQHYLILIQHPILPSETRLVTHTHTHTHAMWKKKKEVEVEEEDKKRKKKGKKKASAN